MAFRRESLINFVLNLLWFLSLQFQGCEIAANSAGRIINGEEVKWNSTRYQVSVRLEEIDRYFFGAGHWCGGSIIARHVILTSAHCIWNADSNSFYPANKFTVVMGNLDRSLNNKNSLKFSVNKIITGAHFNSTTLRDDLALMFLNQSIPESFTGRIEIIELNENVNVIDGTTCLVTGWGLTEKQGNSRTLMMAEVPILNKATCSVNYGSTTILNGMLCAGYMSGKSDACSGDSGGPLICNNKLVGIVSFGIGCAKPGYPGVYTDVAFYYDWIKDQAGLNEKSYPLDSYNTDNSTLNNKISFGNSTAKIYWSHFISIILILWNFIIF